jgi:hypothetical protein
LVSDIPAGDGKMANLFLQCSPMITNKCIYRDRCRLPYYPPEEEEGPGSGLALLLTLSWSRFQFLRAGGQETAVASTVAPTAPEVDILEGGLPHQQESDEKDQPANNIDHLTSKEDWASQVT